MVSPKTREGFTRTGKSLKAVRRYYALKNEARRRENGSDERNKKSQEAPSGSKKRRSPDDDKLSKRIAAELKVQKEANERRARYQAVHQIPTERSALPIVLRDSSTAPGPTFFVETARKSKPLTSKSQKSQKSEKSTKTVKSGGTATDVLNNPPVYQLAPSATGCILTCFIIGVVYVVAYIFMVVVESNRASPLTEDLRRLSSFTSIRWLGFGSIPVLLAVPGWLIAKKKLSIALVCSILMLLNLINLSAYIVVSNLTSDSKEYGSSRYVTKKNALNFWLPITYMLYNLIAISLMLRHVINSVSKKISDHRVASVAEHDRMSVHLAPSR